MNNVGLMIIAVGVVVFSVSDIQAQGNLDRKSITIDQAHYGSLMEAFREIQQQAGFMFVFQPTLVDQFEHLYFPKGTRTVQEFLDALLAETPVGFEENGRNIIIFRKPITFIVKGRVTEQETGEPLPYATVYIRDGNDGTITDSTGSFTIKVVKNETLVISYVGKVTQHFAISSDRHIDAALRTLTLEVVTINTGYYTIQKAHSVGNIVSTSAKEIRRAPVANPLQAMQGRMPGVFVEQMSGIPGSGYTVRIRGRNSLREEGNNPLYIIDGVPYPSISLSAEEVGGDIAPRSNPLNNIDPANIIRIDVLKDADATAIYGSRGANGVILITTKRVVNKGPWAEARVYRGIGQVAHRMDLLNAKQWLTMRHEAFENDGVAISEENARDLTLWDTTRNTDWQKKLIGGTAQVMNANVSFYGGEKLTRFMLAGDYRKETTVFPDKSDYTRAGTLFNLEHTSEDERFQFSLAPNYSYEKMILPVSDLTAQAMMLSPVAPALYNAYGRLNWENDTWVNPLAYTVQSYESKTDNLIVNSNGSYRILANLYLRANVGFNYIERVENRIEPIGSHSTTQIWQGGVTGTNIEATRTLNTFITEPQIDYSLESGLWKLNVLVGATYQSSMLEGGTITATGFKSDDLIHSKDTLVSDMKASNTIHSPYKYAALFSRINYIWGNRYIFNLTARRDGSSRFGRNRQFGTFGAIGAGWIFTNEKFLDRLEELSFGKIRFSYGTSGSDQVGEYGYLGLYLPTQSGYDGSGIVAMRPDNPNLTWELSRKMEFGLALGGLRNRIQLDASYYRNRSSQQIATTRAPQMTGFEWIQRNAPVTLQSSGLELMLSTTVIDGVVWSWTSAANLTMPRNKIVRYDDLANSVDNGRFMIGSPVEIRMLYRYRGINPQTGGFTFEDKNNDGLDATDRYPLTYGPRLYGGIDNVIRYRNFELSFLMQFVEQTRQSVVSFLPVAPGRQTQNQPVEVMQRWRKEGDNASGHRFTQGAGLAEYRQGILNGDMTYGDASYIRLKSASLSYSISSQIVQEKLKIKTLRVFVMGQNLMTFTRFKGLDPESLDPNVLPPLRMITAGIEVNL